MIKNPEIEKTLMASTAHISANDDKLLTGLQHSGRVSEASYGHRVSVVVLQEDKDAFLQEGLSAAFFHLMDEVNRLECQWLHLDSDGPVYDELTKFDW